MHNMGCKGSMYKNMSDHYIYSFFYLSSFMLWKLDNDTKKFFSSIMTIVA
jgi:hypothetical protein